MTRMKDCIATAAFCVCEQSGHVSWYRLHIPSFILVRSLKISSILFTVKVFVSLWNFPRIRSWTSFAVSRAAVECMVFILGLVWGVGLVVMLVDQCFDGWICGCFRWMGRCKSRG